jgi:hypothetical protein
MVKFFVQIDQAAAITTGRVLPPVVGVTITEAELASWTDAERAALAGACLSVAALSDRERRDLPDARPGDLVVHAYACRQYDHAVVRNERLRLAGDTPDAVRAALAASLAAAEEQSARLQAAEAEKRAKEMALAAAEDARLATVPVDALIQDNYGTWAPRYFSPATHPLAAARRPEAGAECARRNALKAAAEKAEAEKKTAEKKAAVDALKAWALENGGELTRARLAEGYDCWLSSARKEYADAAVAGLGRAADDPSGDDGSADEEPRKCPTLPEIEALRRVREALPGGCDAELVRLTYTPSRDEDEDEDGGKVARTEIKVTVSHPTGDMARYLLID